MPEFDANYETFARAALTRYGLGRSPISLRKLAEDGIFLARQGENCLLVRVHMVDPVTVHDAKPPLASMVGLETLAASGAQSASVRTTADGSVAVFVEIDGLVRSVEVLELTVSSRPVRE